MMDNYGVIGYRPNESRPLRKKTNSEAAMETVYRSPLKASTKEDRDASPSEGLVEKLTMGGAVNFRDSGPSPFAV